MSEYKLTSKQIALITESLINYAVNNKCNDEEYQKNMRNDAQEIFNSLINQHNQQETSELMYYNNYVLGDHKEPGLLP